ncbi:MAG: elongation factor G, partial [Candidatus Sericytochromatia bacterium]
LNSCLCQVNWEGTQFNFIDTPGFKDYLHEAMVVLNMVENVIFVLDPLKGLDVTTQKLMQGVQARQLPCLFFINKLDHSEVDFDEMSEMLNSHADFKHLFHLSLPIGAGAQLSGMVEVLEQQAWFVDAAGQPQTSEIPEDVDAGTAYEALVEDVSETDAELLDIYLETGELPLDKVRETIHNSFKEGNHHLLLAGSGKTGVGLHSLVQALVYYGDHPGERAPTVCYDSTNSENTWKVDLHKEKMFCGYVFKTVTDPYVGKISMFRVLAGSIHTDSNIYNANHASQERFGKLMRLMGKKTENVHELSAGDIGAVAKLKDTQTGDTLLAPALAGHPFVIYPVVKPEPIYSVAISPRHKQDENKLASGLHKLKEEDPFFTLSVDPATHQAVLGGVGQTHVELLIERLKSHYGVEVDVSAPRVPYRETILSPAEAQGKHKKQTGGHGQYGDVWLKLEPLPRGSGFQFESQIVGGVVPRNFWPAVEKGVQAIMQEGILIRHAITDVKVTLYDGSSHSVDSSDLAFQLAAKLAFKNAFEKARPTLLEPILNLEITVPESATGSIISDLSSRRGHPLGMERNGSLQIIRAQMPLAEVLGYSPVLTSVSHGQGTFTAEFSHYAEVPELQRHTLLENFKKLHATPVAH